MSQRDFFASRYEDRNLDPRCLYYNYLKHTEMPELLDLNLLYNPLSILNNSKIKDSTKMSDNKAILDKIKNKIKS